MDIYSTPPWVKCQVLGQGSFGTVFSASPMTEILDQQLPRKIIAVKSSYDTGMEYCLREEAQFLHELHGCPQIIRCFGDDISLENGERVYNLLLEYAPGGTLADLINRRSKKSLIIGAVPELEVSWYSYLLLLGLQHIHNRGYVHCDFKPENVLVFPQKDGTLSHLKIADLGLAKKAGCNTVRPIFVNGTGYNHRGTPRYSSPESIMLGIHESPMDIWALGITVVEMLTGRYSAYPDSSLEDLLLRICFDEELPQLPDHNQINISIYGMDFLQRCLIKDPRLRWTADQLLNHPFIVEHVNILRGLGVITEPEILLKNPVAPTSWWSGFSLFSDTRSSMKPAAGSCNQMVPSSYKDALLKGIR